MPCLLPPAEQKWFDGWAARQGRDHGVKITLWNGIELRGSAHAPGRVHVRGQYFAENSGTGKDPEPVHQSADLDDSMTPCSFASSSRRGGSRLTPRAGCSSLPKRSPVTSPRRGDHAGVISVRGAAP